MSRSSKVVRLPEEEVFMEPSQGNNWCRLQVADQDRGGQNVPNARGGELVQRVAPAELGLFDPNLRILCRKGTPENLKFSPPFRFSEIPPPAP